MDVDVSGRQTPPSPGLDPCSPHPESQSSPRDVHSPDRSSPPLLPPCASPKDSPPPLHANGRDSPSSASESARSADNYSSASRSSASAGSAYDLGSGGLGAPGYGGPGGSFKRAPIDTLTRIFPHMKRSVLQLILQGCNGDVMQAIEQVLNNHGEVPSTSTGMGMHGSTGPTSGLPTGSPGPLAAIAHRPYMTMPHSMTPQAAGVKSAFSPITSLAAANAMAQSPLRYAYAAAAGLPNARGLAVAMPYPAGFMPNLAATLGYGYSALAGAQKAALSPYGICGCPYGSDNNDK